ncbi:hypothetical protein PENSPDRAFT_545335, partial [Peniophora sp. CONT]
IDAELQAINHSVAHLCKRRNALTSIGRLPTDIYALIFGFCVAVHSLDRDSSLGWVKVTHVCSTWRRVALSTRQLWSEVTFRLGANWADEI